MWQNRQQHSVGGEASGGNGKCAAKRGTKVEREVPEAQETQGRAGGPSRRELKEEVERLRSIRSVRGREIGGPTPCHP